jgi:hypothetical protein
LLPRRGPGSGRNDGLPGAGRWSGSGIVTSQTLAIAGDFTSIGVASAAEIKGIGATETSVWAGKTVAGNDVLIMYTFGGDANLDGKVNVDDYVRIDSSIGLGIAGWYNGDFNYDGKVNVDDYVIIDSNVGIAQPPFFAGSGAGGRVNAVAIPEPTAALAGALIGTTLLRKRKRKQYPRPPLARS